MLTNRLHLSAYGALALLPALALLAPAKAQQTRSTSGKSMAVLPFHVEGAFEVDDAASLNDQLSAQIFNNGAIDVAEPTKVRAALAEGGFGDICASSCAYAVGERLGVSYVFGAVLTVTDSTCTIAGTVYDVAGKRPIALMKQAGGVGLHELLSTVKAVARDVASSVADTRAQARAPIVRAPVSRPQRTHSSLTITSVPPGAQVRLNGSPVGTTPYQSDQLHPGAYDVAVSKGNYQTYEERIHVAAGARRKLAVRLRSEYGALTVTSVPSGAALVVNDTRLGTTPHTEEQLLPGAYAVQVMLDGYRPDSSLVTIAQGERDTLAVALLSLDSLATARQQARDRRQWTRRIVFGGLGLGFAVAGLIANGQVNAYVDDMEEAATNYNQDGLTPAQYSEYLQRYND
ncbi:MAG: PEGA domain-containing protein, partial [Chitinivibrionales bacterium]|nr:PEGA domain-containing protein [Chitinivibrionales bacterium]